jgi:predicted O-methyltransferase YrrM
MERPKQYSAHVRLDRDDARRVLARIVSRYRSSTALRAGYAFGSSLSRPPQATQDAVRSGRLEEYFDANTAGPGLWKWRHYFPIYERHLGRFAGHQPAVLEIGIYSGGSLGMWHSYFGDGTTVYGVDIEPACNVYASERTKVFIGDQADRLFLRDITHRIPGGLDIILDDGGHLAEQQIPSFEELFPRLNPGGVYICEDVHGPGHAFHKYIAGLARNLHEMPDWREFPANSMQATVESISIYPFVVVIEKRSRRLAKLEAPKHGTEWQPFYERPTDS